jgi:hypothetical protein
MAKVDSGIVRYFIRSKAFRGPESHYLKQGQFSVGLIEASNPPSDTNLAKDLAQNSQIYFQGYGKFFLMNVKPAICIEKLVLFV